MFVYELHGRKGLYVEIDHVYNLSVNPPGRLKIYLAKMSNFSPLKCPIFSPLKCPKGRSAFSAQMSIARMATFSF